MKILLDLQNSMRAVTLNSEFSLCGLIMLHFTERLSSGIQSIIMLLYWG